MEGLLSTGPTPSSFLVSTVAVLGRDKGYAVKYRPLPEGVPVGKSRGNSFRNSEALRGWMKVFEISGN